MRFRITHRTRYTYSGPVFLEPHVFRLRPRCDAAQRLVHFELRIAPDPAARSECLDAEGNVVTQAWFGGCTEFLEVETAAEVETLRENPFDYLLAEAGSAALPMRYASRERMPLAPCLDGEAHSEVFGMAASLARETRGDVLAFLNRLNDHLYEGWHVVVREHGPPRVPEVTLACREGSCRDLAVLFAAACRCQGLAARFVSGYQQGDPGKAKRYLHAWTEVYLPGGGWRGYDPTHGLAVSDRHVAVAAAAEPLDAAPVSGNFRGTGVESGMDWSLEIQA